METVRVCSNFTNKVRKNSRYFVAIYHLISNATRGIIVNYLTLVMDLFYQPSSIRMEHAGLLSSTDAAIYSFKNLAIHQLVQHQPGFRVQHLFLKKHCSKNNQDQKKTCKMFKSKSDQTKLLLKRLSFLFLFLFSRPCYRANFKRFKY